MTALIVFAHGSTVEAANEGVRAVTAAVAADGGYTVVETAFLDCAHPTLSEAVVSVIGRGANRVVVVPFFLTLGVHLQRDLPGIVERLRHIHKGVAIDVTPPLEGHPSLRSIVLERAEEALAGSRSHSQAH
ncbi:MAG TPA: CbiX/SirB N-terminal domain-containing protein [Bryobacteraceae bacterium]|nr:CbiX/SirB N-terminal domain-containing protein [Bryobacteraceae bacterium]